MNERTQLKITILECLRRILWRIGEHEIVITELLVYLRLNKVILVVKKILQEA